MSVLLNAIKINDSTYSEYHGGLDGAFYWWHYTSVLLQDILERLQVCDITNWSLHMDAVTSQFG